LREDFGNFTPASRLWQIANAQSLGFSAGRQQVLTEKYYKLGYYLLHLAKIPGMLKRKVLKIFDQCQKK
jgi:hypothetical protein